MILRTSYWDHGAIFTRETFVGVFVNIWHDHVTWRHVASISYFGPKQIFIVVRLFLILWMGLHEGFPSSGQPLLYDTRFTSYHFFLVKPALDDVLLTSRLKSADVSKIMTSLGQLWRYVSYSPDEVTTLLVGGGEAKRPTPWIWERQLDPGSNRVKVWKWLYLCRTCPIFTCIIKELSICLR